jgi:exopolysaccharide biosynthesis polyprenyl glycosylphosphotransferase
MGLGVLTRGQRRLFLRVVLLGSDLLMLILAAIAASLIRFGRFRHVQALPDLVLKVQFADLSLIVVFIAIIAMWYEGLYDMDRVFWGTGEYNRVAKGQSLAVVAFILATYVLKLPGLSRGWLMLVWGLGILFVVTGRMIVRSVLTSARRRRRLLRPTLMVGYNEEAIELIHRLQSDPSSGLDPTACLASTLQDMHDLQSGSHTGPICLGAARNIQEVLDQHDFDTVVIASTAFSSDVLARVIADLRGRDVDIEISSGLLDVTTSRVLIREVSGVPLITVRGVSFSAGKRFVKRTFDLVVGALIIVVGLPVWLVLALVIKLDSRGPVLYRQTRIGRGGEPFEMYKFRSMTDGADRVRDQLAVDNEASGPLFKMRADPRITGVGMWLRKFSIDEFPQLLNVMRGEMSIVGPRPPLPGETGEYSSHHWRRMEVPPGMTGLWQVSGRSRLTFDEMIRLDLFYIENWSVGFDIGLILRTIPAVVFARGAY